MTTKCSFANKPHLAAYEPALFFLLIDKVTDCVFYFLNSIYTVEKVLARLWWRYLMTRKAVCERLDPRDGTS